MRLEANLSITCTLDGIEEYEMKNEIIKTSQIIGKHVLDLIHSFECCNKGSRGSRILAKACKFTITSRIHRTYRVY